MRKFVNSLSLKMGKSKIHNITARFKICSNLE